jgi:putative transposase
MKLQDELLDMTLIRSKWLNRYWLCIPYKIIVPTTESFPDKILAIDPGIRTFQTWYRSDGSFGQHGHEARKRLLKINNKISALQSQLDRMPNIQKANKEENNEILKARIPLEKKKRQLFLKKQNWITHCHYESMKELTSEEKTLILLPIFQVKQMIAKKERKRGPLSREVKQSMLDLSFYKFRMRFEQYLEKHHERKCHVKIVTEEYTSKTCGNCGNEKKVSGDTYKCNKCKVVLDRDVNGARNILLKAITSLLIM